MSAVAREEWRSLPQRRASRMNVVKRIAREEWRSLFRDRVAVFGLLLLTVLTLVAALNAYEHQRNANAERARYQAQSNHEFESQPDRHPHRAAHFGHFLFRPLSALAAFDPGIDAYTGNTLYLEAHRQNSANFGDVRQSSLLLRFGQLTPAFVLQVLAPLLLVFVGHAGVARERESGTLRILLAQGVGSRQIVLGKLLALSGFAALVLLPSLLALVGIAVNSEVRWPLSLLLAGGYVGWLLLWSLAIVLVSTLLARGRDALLALLAVWAVLVILLPRWIPDVANAVVSLPTRFENEIHVEHDYLQLGDAHNPHDPKFAEFRDKVLKQYGVTRIEDLPVNFVGLVGMEGERQSSELFNRYATAAFELQARQSRLVDAFGWLSPTMALRRLSMTTAGTDLASFRHFLEAGERYRYDLIQRLNQLQAEKLTYASDRDADAMPRISRKNWLSFPEFHYEAASVAETLRRVAPAVAVLLVWIAVLAISVALLSARLGRTVR
jgi:ABC-2 type transport system permease protein